MTYETRVNEIAEEMAKVLHPKIFAWDNDRRNAEEKKIIQSHLQMRISELKPLAAIALKHCAEAVKEFCDVQDMALITPTIEQHLITNGYQPQTTQDEQH